MSNSSTFNPILLSNSNMQESSSADNKILDFGFLKA